MIGLRAQADFLLLRLTPNSLFQEAPSIYIESNTRIIRKNGRSDRKPLQDRSNDHQNRAVRARLEQNQILMQLSLHSGLNPGENAAALLASRLESRLGSRLERHKAEKARHAPGPNTGD